MKKQLLSIDNISNLKVLKNEINFEFEGLCGSENGVLWEDGLNQFFEKNNINPYYTDDSSFVFVEQDGYIAVFPIELEKHGSSTLENHIDFNNPIKEIEIVNVTDKFGNVSKFDYISNLEDIIYEVRKENKDYYECELQSDEVIIAKETFEVSSELHKYSIIENTNYEIYSEVWLPLDIENARKMIDFSKSPVYYDEDDLNEIIELVGGLTNRHDGQNLYW